MLLNPMSDGGERGQNALLKIVTKQYLGHLMILEVVLEIAAKQCLRILTLDFDT